MFIIIKFSKQTTQERKRKIERVLSKKKTLRVLNAVIVYVCVKVNLNDCLLLISYLPN